MKINFFGALTSARLRRYTLCLSFVLALLGLVACSESNGENDSISDTPVGVIPITVFKNPSCGCCDKWVKHIETAGFSAVVENTQDLNSIKSRYGIAPRHQSCHTGVAKGYVFEGHIPVHIMQRFLAEKPQNAIGLSVPGMPLGSPGMEMGDRHDDYDVLLLKTDGSTEVYQHIVATADAQN